MASTLTENRSRQNKYQETHLTNKGHQKMSKMDLKIGDLVFLRANPDKHKVRDLFTVVGLPEKEMIDIKKTEGQFRSKSIRVRYQELIKANIPSNSIETDQSEHDDLDQSEHDVNQKSEKILQSEDDVKVKSRPQRDARTQARQRINDMKSMISRKGSL